MKKLLSLLALVCTLLLTACSDSDVAANITVDSESLSVSLAATKNSNVSVTFSSTKSWTAASAASWISIDQRSGEAGESCRIFITATEANNTDNERVGYVTLASGTDMTRTITVTQAARDRIEFEQTTYEVPAEGTDSLTVLFRTNITDIDNVRCALSNGTNWIHFGVRQTEQSADTRATLERYGVTFNVDANTASTPRSAYLYFVRMLSDSEYDVLDAVTINQLGSTTESTDFSADGQIRTIQTHTVGNGVPLVFLGDGFLDTDIADGWYDQVVDTAVEHFFSEEPARSLRDYFDIYSISVVSPNNIFGSGYKTAFSSEFEGGGSTGISGDDDLIKTYVKTVPGINWEKAQAIVLLNSTQYAGTTYFGFLSDDKSRNVDFAVAYCPIIDGIDSETFCQVLVHESVGHGFAKLDDEYSYEEMGTIPSDEIKDIQQIQSQLGWYMNVDFTTDTDAVLWSAFLADSRYADQGLGIYEGADTYMYGVYRPTENSMMRENVEGFNAPSRQQIYNRVMRDGAGVTPTLEEFITFDLAHPYRTATTTKAAAAVRSPWLPRFHRPVMVNPVIR